jgi:hypothetical protein
MICKCGHSKKDHYSDNKLCGLCYWLDRSEFAVHQFKLDNLKYLEQLSESNNCW